MTTTTLKTVLAMVGLLFSAGTYPLIGVYCIPLIERYRPGLISYNATTADLTPWSRLGFVDNDVEPWFAFLELWKTEKFLELTSS